MSEWRIQHVTDETPDLIEAVRELFREYHTWLGEVVCSVRLAEEIESLPGPYSPPEGRLLLAITPAEEPAGVVGVRPFDGTQCEIKRLYVRPGFRGSGLGRRLAEEAIASAAQLGYAEALLTTLPGTMAPALALYRRLGFAETDPFMDLSHVEEGAEMLYMRRPLGG